MCNAFEYLPAKSNAPAQVCPHLPCIDIAWNGCPQLIVRGQELLPQLANLIEHLLVLVWALCVVQEVVKVDQGHMYRQQVLVDLFPVLFALCFLGQVDDEVEGVEVNVGVAGGEHSKATTIRQLIITHHVFNELILQMMHKRVQCANATVEACP